VKSGLMDWKEFKCRI